MTSLESVARTSNLTYNSINPSLMLLCKPFYIINWYSIGGGDPHKLLTAFKYWCIRYLLSPNISSDCCVGNIVITSAFAIRYFEDEQLNYAMALCCPHLNVFVCHYIIVATSSRQTIKWERTELSANAGQ